MSLRIGILGAARIAPAAVVLPAQALAGTEVVCVGARVLADAQGFAAAHGIPAAHEGYGAVIEAADVDLVYVALPTSAHAEWTIRAAEAGKHVLCEKSFAMDSTEAAAMLAAGAAAGVRIIEAFHHRYHPAFAAFLDIVRGGEIGTVAAIDAEFSAPIADRPGEFRYSPALGGGAMRDLGCYPLNWCLSLDDTAVAHITVDAVLTASGVDESVEAAIGFASGVSAQVRCSMAPAGEAVRRLRVDGSKGAVTFENPVAPHIGSRIIRSGAPDLVFGAASQTTYFHQLGAIVTAISQGGALPTEGAAIIRQQAALDRICAQFGVNS